MHKKLVLSLLVVILFLGVFSAVALAAYLTVYSPKDAYYTYNDVVMLKGKAKGYASLTVNGNQIDVGKDGRFAAGLFLAPGKNYVEIVGKTKSGAVNKASRRIIHAISFPDIMEIKEKDPKHYSIRPIIDLTTLGIIEAYPDNNFYPKGWLTKGELATWLVKSRGIQVAPPEFDPAPDVPREHWRAPFIKMCLDKGWMQLYPEGNFGLGDGIMRADAVAMAMKMEGITTYEDAKQIFYDVPLLNAEAKAVYAAWKRGWVKGISDKYRLFDPNRYITREEAATLLSRLPSVKKKIKYLYDYSKGYGKSSYAKINTTPKILWFGVNPERVIKNSNQIVLLKSKVTDRQGYADISVVRVDLRELGGPPDAEMYDLGKQGDEKEGDSIYTLQIAVSAEATGSKTLKVTAMDRKGWEDEAYNSLLVVE